jgi:hypothetical protein
MVEPFRVPKKFAAGQGGRIARFPFFGASVKGDGALTGFGIASKFMWNSLVTKKQIPDVDRVVTSEYHPIRA